MTLIGAEMLVLAIETANAEKHPAQQAYVDADHHDEVVLDGHFDLERVAELLEEMVELLEG